MFENGRMVRDTDRSLWLPGAECADGSVPQAFDGLATVVLVLAAGGVVIFAIGAVAAIKDLRTA